MKHMKDFKNRIFEFPFAELDNFQPDGTRADLTKVGIQSLKITQNSSTFHIPLEIKFEGIVAESSMIVPPHNDFNMLTDELLDRHLVHDQVYLLYPFTISPSIDSMPLHYSNIYFIEEMPA